MKNVVLKNTLTGLFYAEGSGFTAKTAAEATRLDAESAECNSACAKKMGFGQVTTEALADKSFGVVYIRKGDLDGQSLDKQAPNAALNQFDPSPRRFATFDEARIHGSRFHVRRADRGDARNSGTCSHRGFYIVDTTDPVNSSVNPATGLTNPIK